MALTKAHNRMIEGGVVNVKDFGAVGNGITDDTSSIQAAADHCNSTGQSLFVPTGNYVITSTITFTQINVECEDARTVKFTANGNFTAFKFIAAGKTFRNFNLWFVPPVTSAAIGYQFGEGASQFARCVVENFSVRYAYKGFFNNSDMWGNTFSQINSDFSLNYGFQFTANPSGTTNSFRNIYATNAHTTGTISSGSASLTVADATNLSAGLPVVVLGAGSSGPLLTTISSVSGTTVTLATTASTSVTDTRVLLRATAWSSTNFSDLHFFNAYFDNYPSSANSLNGCVVFTDSFVWADALRFETCAIVANNTGLVDDRSNMSKIETILSFAHLVDAGTGNYGFIYRCGTGAFTQHTVGDLLLQGFIHYSGGLKKMRVSSNDNLTYLGRSATVSDVDTNGFNGCLFFSSQDARFNGASPATGSWDVGDVFTISTPTISGQLGGICLTAGTYGTLSGTTATTSVGSNLITFNTFGALRRNQFITISGVSGVYKVVDIQTGTSNVGLVVPAIPTAVSAAAVSYATPTFGSTGTIS